MNEILFWKKKLGKQLKVKKKSKQFLPPHTQ